jgi:hypothetical protein
MFNPCTDQKYKGERIVCVGQYYNECDNCILRNLDFEVDSLKRRIERELEPRIKAERRQYDLQLGPKE